MTDPAEWLDQHGDYLFRYALRQGVTRELAEDILQETMLAGIRGLAGFRQGSSVRTWLVSILRNRLLDHFRKSSRESTQQAEEADLEAYFAANGLWLAQQSNPERRCQFRDLMKMILLCLGELNERSKRLFLMAEFEGMEPSELAEPFALNPENVRVILHRARIKLRGCLLKGGFSL
jgi:RNA polymerase sigma-70 factor (ECF subfamily)